MYLEKIQYLNINHIYVALESAGLFLMFKYMHNYAIIMLERRCVYANNSN